MDQNKFEKILEEVTPENFKREMLEAEGFTHEQNIIIVNRLIEVATKVRDEMSEDSNESA